MLGGELPSSIEAVFAAAGLSLFPTSARDLALDCTCPDHAVPCKHLAAVCYVLAERFDADPFQILALRGRDRPTLLTDLRSRRAALRAEVAHVRDGPADPPAEPTEDDLAELAESDPGAFWSAPSVQTPVGPPVPSDALLDQVPAFPVTVRGVQLTEVLRPLYRALSAEP
jgi:uncharacterized Zn finger protein